jgi:hypothetical protein
MVKAPLLSPPGLKPAAASPYFVGPKVDFLLIGGFSLLLFLLLAPFSPGRTGPIIMIAGWLMWIGNWPHFAATNYRLYHAKENIAQYPVTALVVPLVMLGAVILAFASPTSWAPLWVKLFLLWSPYHFSGQSVGISLVYAARSGWKIGRLERFALSSFIFSTFIYPTALSEAVGTPYPYFGVEVPRLGIPKLIPDLALLWMLFSGLLLLALVVRWSVMSRRLPPLIVLLPSAAQLLWFVLGRNIAGYTEFVPFFHGIQYLLIAWAVQLKEKMQICRIAPSKQYVMGESGRWYLGIGVVGVVLFWALPRLGVLFAGTSLLIAEPIVISAVQIHHFFVDGVIWKLRNPRVGSALLVNLEEMARGEPSASGRPA